MEEYNPADHRQPEKLKLGAFQVFIHLIKATLGTGELFMPYAFRRTGYVAALACSVVMGIVTTHTAVLVVTCSQTQCRRSRVPKLDFAGTAETSFRNGPGAFRRYARAIKLTTNVFLCFVQYQTIVIYTLYVASSYQQVFEYLTSWEMDLRLYVLVFLPFFYMLSLVPDLSYLVPLSVLSGMCLAVGLILTFYFFFRDIPSFSGMQKFTEWSEVSIFCSVFMFALHNFPILMPLENSMRQPEKMARVTVWGMAMSILMVVCFGFFGYNKYNNSQDTVIKNLPLDNMLAETVKVTVTTSVLLSYGLHYYVPVSILWPIISKKVGDKKALEVIFRLTGVTVCTLTAAAVPEMAPLLSLFAAVSISTVMLLIPILIETATKWQDSAGGSRCLLALKNSFLLLLWAFIMFFGAQQSLRDLARPKCS